MIKNILSAMANGRKLYSRSTGVAEGTAQNKSINSSQITQENDTSGEFRASLLTDSEHKRPTQIHTRFKQIN